MKRKIEFLLSFLGNIAYAVLYTISWSLYAGADESVTIHILPPLYVMRGWEAISPFITFAFVAIGIAGAFLINKKNTLAGFMVLASGFMAVGGEFPWYLLWSLPQITSGLMVFTNKQNSMSPQHKAN